MRIDNKQPIKVENQNITVDIVYILDSSGSMMGSKYNEGKNGFIEEFNTLSSQVDINYSFTLIEFDRYDRIRTHFYKENNKTIISSKLETLRVFGDMTALHDAVGNTLTTLLKDNRGNKTLVSIITDGDNNDSRVFNSNSVKELISKCEKEGFTITFIGTEKDTNVAIRSYGISKSNTLTHDNTGDGFRKMSATRTSATLNYSKKLMKGEAVTEEFYSNK